MNQGSAFLQGDGKEMQETEDVHARAFLLDSVEPLEFWSVGCSSSQEGGLHK